ncbi:MAG: hypothetical protein IPG73_13745 [Ignavibacteria bacterium]|nr:hypothetical protein [Ignavibacteria bacterium]
MPIVEVRDIDLVDTASDGHNVKQVALDLEMIVDSAILTRAPRILEPALSNCYDDPFSLRKIKYVKGRLATRCDIGVTDSINRDAVYGGTNDNNVPTQRPEIVKIGEWLYSSTHESHTEDVVVSRNTKTILGVTALAIKYSNLIVIVDPFFCNRSQYAEFWTSLLEINPLFKPAVRIVRKQASRDNEYDAEAIEDEYRSVWTKMKGCLSKLEIVTIQSIHDRHLLCDQFSFTLTNGFDTYSRTSGVLKQR